MCPPRPSDRPLQQRIARWTYPYAPVAAATFLLGALLGGVAVALTPPDALQGLAASSLGTDPFPDRITTWTVFRNNVVVLGIVALGAGTFAATTVFALLFNGFLLGAVAAGSGDLLVTLALVLPHGVFELGAFFLVAGAAYRVTWRLVAYLRGVDDRPLTRPEAVEAVAILLVGVAVLALAAWIEATLTLPIARALTGVGG